MPLRSLGMWIGQAQRATASGERIFQVMDEPEEVADRPDAIELPPGRGDVRFEGVSFEYLDGRPVLHDVDLDVPAGRTVALIGHTGSGKTTLTSLVPRFYDATDGPGDDRRPRRPRPDARLAPPRDRRHLAGSVPLLGDRAREHRVRRRRPPAGGGRGGRARGPGARVHRAAAAGLRHGDRRARDHALRRPAPAARDRPRARGRPAHPDPRRRDRVGRRLDRGADPRSACAARWPAGRRSSSPTACRRSRSPTRSSSSTDGRIAARGTHERADRDEPGLPRDLRARPARAPVRGRGRGPRRGGGGGA